MKLLLYSHFFAPSIGGVETLVLSLASGLSHLRTANGQPQFQVTLVTQTAVGSFADGSLLFPVVRQPTRQQLWKLIRSTDVLHVAGTALVPMLLGRLAAKPVVVEHHGFQAICPNGQLLMEPAATPCPGHFMAGRHAECLRCNSGNGWLKSLRMWLLTFARRSLCKGVAANITPTQWLGDLIHLPHEFAIPHGLELPPLPLHAPTTEEPPVIAFLGRLVTTKGVATLLAAAEILQREKQHFTVWILGEGPERPALESLAKAKQLDTVVHFAGRVRSEDLATLMTGASIVVVPSLGGEVFGLVVAENMLRGLPVVTSDLGAFVEVLGEAGLTFPTGDAEALAAQLARLLSDPSLRVTLGQQARRRAANFCDLQRMLESHASVYRKVFAQDLIPPSPTQT